MAALTVGLVLLAAGAAKAGEHPHQGVAAELSRIVNTIHPIILNPDRSRHDRHRHDFVFYAPAEYPTIDSSCELHRIHRASYDVIIVRHATPCAVIGQ